MTNYERIKSMSIEETAKMFCDSNRFCEECQAYSICSKAVHDSKHPYASVIKYLKSEAAE